MLIPMNDNLVILEPASSIDLIFKYVKSKNDQKTLENFFDKIDKQIPNEYQLLSIDLKHNFLLVKQSLPKIEYNQIYKLFEEHDKIYFNSKMNQFRGSICGFFDQINSAESAPSNNSCELNKLMVSFIAKLRLDLCLELSMVYHRLRHFPQERSKLYNKFPNHSYVKLIKFIHQNFTKNKNKSNKTYKDA